MPVALVSPSGGWLLLPPPASSAESKRGRPPATYRSAAHLIALCRSTRDQRPVSPRTSAKVNRGDGEGEGEPERPRGIRTHSARPHPQSETAGGRDPTHAIWGQGQAVPEAQFIGGKLESVSVK